MKKFKKIMLPPQWKEYWTAYPHGYTILEALVDWLSEFNDIVENVNDWNEYLDDFVKNFEFELQEEVKSTITRWQNEGLLDDIISSALNTELDNVKLQLEEIENKGHSEVINIQYPPPPLKPVFPDGSDNTAGIKAIIQSLEVGQTLFIPRGTYKLTESLQVEKPIKIIGESVYSNYGTILEFYGCNGLEIQNSGVHVDFIHLKGINKAPFIDIKSGNYGTIGLKCEYSSDNSSGGTRINNLTVSGFNVGVAMYPEGTQTWAGAYREFTNPQIIYNDIGLLALNGATHNKFYGGVINHNSIHGIYSSAPDYYYNNIEFVGTTIESNGGMTPFSEDGFSDFGIYSGANSKLKFTNAYFEKMVMFADAGGTILINNCHVHHNVKMFARGTILDSNSIGNYANKKIYTGALAEQITPGNVTVTNVSELMPHVRITSNYNGENSITFPSPMLYSVPVKYVKGIKLSFQLKINGGTKSPDFGIKPQLRINGKNSVDGMNIDITFPLDIMQPDPVLGIYQNYEIYYRPRIGDGYLDPNDILRNIWVILRFTNSRTSDNSDYSTHNLDIEIMNPIVTVYSDIEHTVG